MDATSLLSKTNRRDKIRQKEKTRDRGKGEKVKEIDINCETEGAPTEFLT